MLQRLAELGMTMAERLAENPEPTDAAALQFARVAKAIRQALALEAQFAGALEVRPPSARPIRVPPWEPLGLSQAEYEAEDAAVERLGDAERLMDRIIDRDPRERLHDQFRADVYDAIEGVEEAGLFASDLPLSQIVTRIASDLGLEPDWHGLSEADWAYTDHRIRADLKAGVVLAEEPPPGWPAPPRDRPPPVARAARPPDG
jgi:hypothetical protein